MTTKLQKLRSEIDDIDIRLLQLLAVRILVSQKIGQEKKQLQQSIHDTVRESEVLNQLIMRATDLGLDTTLVTEIWQCIFTHSKQIQDRV